MADCDRCARPQTDTAYVCSKCTGDLARLLATVPSLAEEIETTVARLARHGERGHGGSVEPPLPVDLAAADKVWAAGNVLTTWARHCAETRGLDVLIVLPGEQPMILAARFLAAQLGWLRMRQEAADAYDEIEDAVCTLRRVVDSPPALWYAGPCGAVVEGAVCQVELYARPEAGIVRCRECGAEHDADRRRAWLLDQARDQLLHAGWLASAVSALGTELKVDRIYKWAERGRITQHGTDGVGRPLYRVADALELLRA